MKRVIYIATLFMALLSMGAVFGSGGVYLNVDIPEEIEVGENFTVDVYVNLNRNISGFECSIDTSIHGTGRIQFINATEDEEIKKKAGNFYIVNLKNNSVFISFALFDKPINSDFHLITVKGKALKEGNLTVRFTAVASDDEGRSIKIPPVTYNIEIVGNNQVNNENTDDGNILSWIIGSILKILFGG